MDRKNSRSSLNAGCLEKRSNRTTTRAEELEFQHKHKQSNYRVALRHVTAVLWVFLITELAKEENK